MIAQTLGEFLKQLEQVNQLKVIEQPVSPILEMTELGGRYLREGGPALLYRQPSGYALPVVTNLFATQERVAMALGLEDVSQLRSLGELLASLRDPSPPSNLKALWGQWPLYRRALSMAPKVVKHPECQQCVLEGAEVDLGRYPVMTCWPGDAGPLITWGAVITQGPFSERQNMGIYRLQVIDRNRVIMRWLGHRGGALDYQAWQRQFPDRPFPVAVAIGMDPCALLAAVMPVPDTLSELRFAGILRGKRSEVCQGLGVDLTLPASAEIVLEGHIHPGDTALEGPFADHTGYYNEAEHFPVLTLDRITQKQQPLYLSTWTGRPPDEPAILGEALNELFIPILQRQFPEIVDFYLPSAGCSYRVAYVSIRKQYPGHARRIMMGIWSWLRQFSYTKYIVVTDEDINIRSPDDMLWAISTRTDPARDLFVQDKTPIDVLDFASPVAGLGGKMGLDATHKWPGETQREWGKTVSMTHEVQNRIDRLMKSLQEG